MERRLSKRAKMILYLVGGRGKLTRASSRRTHWSTVRMLSLLEVSRRFRINRSPTIVSSNNYGRRASVKRRGNNAGVIIWGISSIGRATALQAVG